MRGQADFKFDGALGIRHNPPMSRLFLLLTLLSALMGLAGAATLFFMLALACAFGWLLFGPGGLWL